MSKTSVIVRYDEHAKQLGQLIATWAVSENLLTLILGALLQVEQSRAQVIYREFIGTGAKFNLMRRLAHVYVDDSPVRKQLISLLGDAQRCVTIRNKFAHATWGGDPNDRQCESLVLFHGTPPSKHSERVHPPETVTANDIKVQVEKLNELNVRLTQFVVDVLPSMSVRDLPSI